MTTSTPQVFVGPADSPALERAVRNAGGDVVPLANADAIIYQGPNDPQATADLLHPGVRWLQLPNAGVEKWTTAGVVTADPVWTSASGAYGPQVAEHALALLLLAARELHTYARSHEWTSKRGRTLAGSVVSLVGFGGIGRDLLPLLRALDARVWAVTDSGQVENAERTVPRAAYRDLLPDSDFVVLLAPSTPATRGMIGATEFAIMKSDAWLINVVRGDLVVTADLLEALQHEHIAGAALDVTDPEPLPAGHPLWSQDRAFITPHSANPDAVHDRSLARRVSDNVERFGAGQQLLGVIDPQSGF